MISNTPLFPRNCAIEIIVKTFAGYLRGRASSGMKMPKPGIQPTYIIWAIWNSLTKLIEIIRMQISRNLCETDLILDLYASNLVESMQ